MKKFLAIFLTLCMIGSMVPVMALAEDALPEELFEVEELLPEELIPAEEPFAPAEEEALPPEVLTEEPALLEELTEVEANEAALNLVFSYPLNYPGGTFADFEINYSVTEELKNAGYRVGMAFSTGELQLREDGRFDNQWTFEPKDSEGNYAESGTASQMIDVLLPGRTYNVCAVITDLEDRVLFQEEQLHQITTKDDASGIKELKLDAEAIALEPSRTMFTFTAEATGLYAVEGTHVNNIDILDANGKFVAGANREEPGGLNAIFLAEAGTPLYISVGVWDEEVSLSSIVLREGEAYADKLSVGAAPLHADQVGIFTAEKTGWYSFTIDGDPSRGGMHRFDEAAGAWVWVDNGTYSAKLAAGDNVILQGQYDEHNQGARTLTIAEVTAPEANAITSADAPANVGTSGADIEVTVSATEELAEQGYRYGVFYNPVQEDLIGGKEWSMEGHSVMNCTKATVHPDQLVPGITYYYKAYIRSMATGEIVALEEDVHQFTTESGTEGIIPLTVDAVASVPNHQPLHYMFTAPAAGYYALASSGTDYYSIMNAAGEEIAGSWNEHADPNFVYNIIFYADAGQTVYISTHNPQDAPAIILIMRAATDTPRTEAELIATLATLADDTGWASHGVTVDTPITLTKDATIPRNTALYVESDLTIASGATLTNLADIYLEQGSKLTLANGATVAQQSAEDGWMAAITMNGGSIINAGGTIENDGNGVVVLSLDEYDNDFEKALAATGGCVDKKDMIVAVGVETQAQLEKALSFGSDIGLIEIYLNGGPFTAPGVIAENITLVIEAGNRITIPAGETVNVAGAIVLLKGASIDSYGTIDLTGLIQWNAEGSFTNNGTLNVKPGSVIRIARWQPIAQAEITNNGKVSRQGGTIAENVKIQGGTVVDEDAMPEIPSDKISGFILRCYTRGLGRDEEAVRSKDMGGLAYWYDIVKNKKDTPAHVGKYFAISDESKAKYPENADFVAMLYRLFMEDRSFDQGGYDYWMNLLETETLTREQVIDYFGASPEFQEIVKSYGLA